MGHRQVEQTSLFYEFSLERHVPSDHLLRSIDRFVLEQIRQDLAPFYSKIGRPSMRFTSIWPNGGGTGPALIWVSDILHCIDLRVEPTDVFIPLEGAEPRSPGRFRGTGPLLRQASNEEPISDRTAEVAATIAEEGWQLVLLIHWVAP